jgi:hypothetical protein
MPNHSFAAPCRETAILQGTGAGVRCVVRGTGAFAEPHTAHLTPSYVIVL